MIMKFKENRKQNFNVFFALLRMYLSLLVINTHCFRPSKSFYKYIYIAKLLKNNIHVPIFYIMSFYFCYELFSSKNIIKIKLRFERIIIPYIIWPIIFYILNNFLINYKNKITVNDLIKQLLYGHNFFPVLWFQYVLIIMTLIIVISELLFVKFRFYFLII